MNQFFNQNPDTPVENRIADKVVLQSIVKVVEEDKLDEGNCSVVFELHNYIPEQTPEDFSPSNDLEELMHLNKASILSSLSMPFSFKEQQLITGLAANFPHLENLYDVEISTYKAFKDGTPYTLIELISRKLSRSLYIKVISYPNP